MWRAPCAGYTIEAAPFCIAIWYAALGSVVGRKRRSSFAAQKPANVVIDSKWVVKICDFGLSEVLIFKMGKDVPGQVKGSPLWMSPEVLDQKDQFFTTAADVYSYGVVLWQCLSRVQPWANVRDIRTLKKLVCQDGKRPIIPEECPRVLRQLIESCWAQRMQEQGGAERVCLCLLTHTGRAFGSASLRRHLAKAGGFPHLCGHFGPHSGALLAAKLFWQGICAVVRVPAGDGVVHAGGWPPPERSPHFCSLLHGCVPQADEPPESLELSDNSLEIRINCVKAMLGVTDNVVNV